MAAMKRVKRWLKFLGGREIKEVFKEARRWEIRERK